MPTVLTKGFIDTDGTANGDYVDEISVDTSVELITRKGTDGVTKKVDSVDPTSEFSIKGGGAPTLALGVGAVSIKELEGGVKAVEKKNHTQKRGEYDEFSTNGKHFPGAS
jgi:hypothetical protein